MSRFAGAILVLSLAFYVAFIASSARPIASTSGFTLFDDAMISMRYARNLAEGHGLVWNPGEERVEGITNLLWTLVMAALHLLRLPDTKISLAVSTVGAALLFATLLSLRRLAHHIEGRDGPITLGALFLTGLYYPMAFWTLRGLEVGLLAFLLLEALRTALQARETPPARTRGRLAMLLGAALLTRPDAVIPAAILLAWTWTSSPREIRRSVVMPALGACVGIGVLLTGFRLVYYGDALPNTVALKIGGRPLVERAAHGARAFADVMRAHLGGLLAAIVAGAFARPGVFSRPVVRLALLVFLGQAAYSISAGGDSWEWMDFSNRFLCVAMPGLFLVGSMVIAELAGRIAAGRLRGVLTTVAILAVAASLNTSPMTIWIRDGAFHVSDDAAMARFGLEIRSCTAEDARIAVVWAGTVPYFSRRPCIDLLGKNDRIVARGAVVGRYQPGHDKWNARHSIGELRPDVIAQTSLVWQEPGFWEVIRSAGYDRLPNGICVRRDTRSADAACLASLNAPSW